MSTGCNSEFEGEIEYQPAHAIVTKLLDAAADSILEFINIPINDIKFILDDDVCDCSMDTRASPIIEQFVLSFADRCNYK
jgi:hypothetical protein